MCGSNEAGETGESHKNGICMVIMKFCWFLILSSTFYFSLIIAPLCAFRHEESMYTILLSCLPIPPGPYLWHATADQWVYKGGVGR
ncbi:hypothetical protein BJX61DRAFT_530021 [Aspergillus egyptiacus]|nr:hypothetical protein BJX61DRAFT_530021 [Aspergillus egyptiacus]